MWRSKYGQSSTGCAGVVVDGRVQSRCGNRARDRPVGATKAVSATIRRRLSAPGVGGDTVRLETRGHPGGDEVELQCAKMMKVWSQRSAAEGEW